MKLGSFLDCRTKMKQNNRGTVHQLRLSNLCQLQGILRKGKKKSKIQQKIFSPGEEQKSSDRKGLPIATLNP
jgi:hypothetical protein